METVCRECGIEFDIEESLRRHVKKHRLSFQEYSLKWFYEGVIPSCLCGCGQETLWNTGYKRYAEYVRGHSALGRKRTEEQKRKIGQKNSLHMKKLYRENPQLATQKIDRMNAARTPETEAKRIQATKEAYENMREEYLQKFSDRAKNLWKNGILANAHIKATETFKERFAAGEYDFVERNKKISETVTQKYLEGGFQWSKGEYISVKTGKNIYYRSSWERQYAEQLDADDEVETWNYEFTSIPYVLDGINRNYVPDFYVKMKNGIEKLV